MPRVVVLTFVLMALICSEAPTARATDCDEAKVRVFLVDLAAGAPIAVLQSQEKGDPNAHEAIARWDAGVRPRAPERFDRKLQYGKGWKVVFSGTRVVIDASEVRLTTDGRLISEREGNIRLHLLSLALGAPVPGDVASDPDLALALRRRETGVTVGNLALFERSPSGALSRKGTARPVEGWQVNLSSDPGSTCYSEAHVRRILADIELGGPPDYYEGHPDEPGVGEALRRRAAGVRVMNLAGFERNIVKGKGWQVVHKRSHVPIDGTEVELR